ATSEILRVISSSPTEVQPVFDTIVQNAGRVCDSMDAALVLADGAEMVVAAPWGPIAGPPGTRFALAGEAVSGRAILQGRAVHVEDLSVRPDFPEGQALAIQMGHRTTLAVPLLRESRAIGSLLIRRTEVRPFSDKQIALLETFANQAVIAIENVRLFNETKEALEQQTATADILKVISSSPTNVQPVFDAITANALSLCAAPGTGVSLLDRELIPVAALRDTDPAGADAVRNAYPMPPSRVGATARAILTREAVYIRDVLQDPEYKLASTAAAVGFRSIMSVPMLHEGIRSGPSP